MNLFVVGLTLDTLGKILLGVAVLMVHWHLYKEHKIDREVLTVLSKERLLALLGIVLIIVGSILQMIFHLS